jgi:hypothetical protein
MLVVGGIAGAALLAYVLWPSSASAAGISGRSPTADKAEFLADTLAGRYARPLYYRPDGSAVRITRADADAMVAAGTHHFVSALRDEVMDGAAPPPGGPIHGERGTAFDQAVRVGENIYRTITK